MDRQRQMTPDAVRFASSLRSARWSLLTKPRDEREAMIDAVCDHLRRDDAELARRVGDYLRWRRL